MLIEKWSVERQNKTTMGRLMNIWNEQYKFVKKYDTPFKGHVFIRQIVYRNLSMTSKKPYTGKNLIRGWSKRNNYRHRNMYHTSK